MFSDLWDVERISLMTNSSEHLLTLCSSLSMILDIYIYIYKYVSPSNQSKVSLKKIVKTIYWRFLHLTTEMDRAALHSWIWPMEFHLLCISKLVVGTPGHGKYLYLYESRALIFSNPLLITTSTLHCCKHCCLTDPAPKGYETKLQC